MSGHAVSYGRSNKFRRSFEEHGIILGFMRIIPRTEYQQGIPRWLQRFDNLDFGTPEFANLGEQEIKKREIVAEPGSTYDELFGYQSRFAEYKYTPSTTHGDLKEALDYWTMTRKLIGVPSLDTDFVMADPTNRIFAVTDPVTQHLVVQCLNRTHAIRPLPYFGTPML